MTYLDIFKLRKLRKAQLEAAQDAAHDMLCKLTGEDYSDSAHRIATDHLLLFHQRQCRME